MLRQWFSLKEGYVVWQVDTALVEIKMSIREIWDSGPASTLLIFMRIELFPLLHLALAVKSTKIGSAH